MRNPGTFAVDIAIQHDLALVAGLSKRAHLLIIFLQQAGVTNCSDTAVSNDATGRKKAATPVDFDDNARRLAIANCKMDAPFRIVLKPRYFSIPIAPVAQSHGISSGVDAVCR